jgi:hypothetical protein
MTVLIRSCWARQLNRDVRDDDSSEGDRFSAKECSSFLL